MKILIIRFSSIGDIVLTTPVIRCLKQQLPEAEIHFLTKNSFLPVVEANPYIDKVYGIHKNVEEVMLSLKGESYRYIIDLHNNLRSRMVRIGLGTKTYSFNKINVQKWLMTRLKINLLPKVHIVDRYMKPAEKLGVKNDGKGLDYFIPKKEEVKLSTFFKKSGIGAVQPYIALVIGAAHATKRLPVVRLIELCQQLEGPVILLGGPEDERPGAFIAEQSGGHVVNACGKLKLNESASMVRQAAKVISHDTGLMHIAAAFDKEIISVWGNTIPEFGMYPYYGNKENRNTTLEVKGLSCRPCSKIGHHECPKKHFKCMVNIDFSDLPM
ncbi:MAG: glycosyltransferase family 9 protein [Lewinellaceae bacterium]|nr:glycosyltransferase family 9 protein [Lewinellaceae bacterium]